MYSKQNEKNNVVFNGVHPVKCEAIFNGVKKALITPAQSLRSLRGKQVLPALPR